MFILIKRPQTLGIVAHTQEKLRKVAFKANLVYIVRPFLILLEPLPPFTPDAPRAL